MPTYIRQLFLSIVEALMICFVAISNQRVLNNKRKKKLLKNANLVCPKALCPLRERERSFCFTWLPVSVLHKHSLAKGWCGLTGASGSSCPTAQSPGSPISWSYKTISAWDYSTTPFPQIFSQFTYLPYQPSFHCMILFNPLPQYYHLRVVD